MSRFVVRFKNGGEQPVDDFKMKANGQSTFVKVIVPYSHERVLYNADQVSSIREEQHGEAGAVLGQNE